MSNKLLYQINLLLENNVYLYVNLSNRPLRACLQGGGGPQIGEVTWGGSPHLTCNRDQIKMRDYEKRRVTLPKRVTSPTWGPPPPCKQALRVALRACLHGGEGPQVGEVTRLSI